MASFTSLLTEIRACTICTENLPHGVRPILQIHPQAQVLIAGQAPGRKAHESGDLPPGPECAPAWRNNLLGHLHNLEVTLLVGQYAQAYHLSGQQSSLTETARAW